MKTKDKWIKVPGYLIEVTKSGKVRDYITKELKTIYLTKSGYQLINSKTDENIFKTKGVHQLVALTFIGPCPQKHEVNHKDLDKQNNCYKNLEYLTRKKNHKHARLNLGNWSIYPNPRKGSQLPWSKLKEKDIPKIFKLHKKGLLQREISKIFGVSRALIGYVLNKKIWRNS
jgi:hypothetical protein